MDLLGKNVLAGIGLSAALSLSACSIKASTRNEDIHRTRPNFVFILVDDLGWADLGCYGSKFYETPNLDQLALQGVRFTDAYASCPVCSPTRASILSGKYPARMDLTDWIPGRPSTGIIPTIAIRGVRPGGAIRSGKYKLIEFYEDRHVELYDLDRDKGESINLADEKLEIVKELKNKLNQWREKVHAKMPKLNPQYQP